MSKQSTLLQGLSLFLHLTLFIPALYGYTLLMEDLSGFSTAHTDGQLIELALLIYLYGLFFSLLKPFPGRGLVAGLPIVLIYLIHDTFYFAFRKVFRLINISELPELLQIIPLDYLILVIATILLLIIFLPRIVDYHHLGKLILWLSPLVLLSIFIAGTPSTFVNNFEKAATEIVTYSDRKSVEYNGRISMMLYREAQRLKALHKLEPYLDRVAYNEQAKTLTAELEPHNNHRNIYLIVLESFLDPRLFSDLGFSRTPVHPEFDKFFGDNLGLSIAPVFGGATAQAEFEVLCGVPALEQLSSVEFNAFTGAQAHCLPSLLGKLGYRSVASNGYKPNFFNALPGYAGMGFAESYFPREFSGARESYLDFGDPGQEEYLFDKPLLDQNLGFIKNHLKQHPTQPLFNYLMTIYGHLPHTLNLEKRPEIIKLESSYPDDHLTRSVNQFYYRTEAIADYVNQLLSIDRESLIILISDHVPPLRNGPNTYNELRYLENRTNSHYHNTIAIIENGEPKVYRVMRHFDLPALILNYMSNGEYCRDNPCAFIKDTQHMPREAYMDNYMKLMAHAAE